MDSDEVAVAQTWRTAHGDMNDEEWELIADLVSPYWSPGSMGRPVKVDRRRVVDAHHLRGVDGLSVARPSR